MKKAIVLLAMGLSFTLLDLNLIRNVFRRKINNVFVEWDESERKQKRNTRKYKNRKYKRKRFYQQKHFKLKGSKPKDVRYSDHQKLRRMFRNM